MFSKAYPYFLNKREAFAVIGIVGIFTFFFCLIFRPFELYQYEPKELILISAINTFVICLSLSISQLIFSFFAKNQDEENWTIVKEIVTYLWHVLVLFTYIFNEYLNPVQINISERIYFVGKRLLVASFIIVPLIILLKRNFILQKNNRHISEIDKAIKTRTNTDYSKSNKVTLISNDKQKDLKIEINNVIYLKASENYVEVFFYKDEKYRLVLLRNTLKNILVQVNYNPLFFRCHRSYVINLNKVKSFTGNSRGYLIQFKNVSTKIPVSRSAIESFKIRINALQKD